MINKKNLWFLTLFSLVLVLSVYYITMPNELLINGNGFIDTDNDVLSGTEIKESSIITALRVEADDQMLEEMNSLKQVLTDLNVTVDEKNNAFEELKKLNLQKGKENELEQKIKNEYKVDAFVKIDGNQIRVVVESSNHTEELANNIMRLVQSNYEEKMYISVKFQN